MSADPGSAVPQSLSAEHRLTAILDGISEGYFALDRAWRLTFFNQAAEQFFGRARTDVLGREFWDVFPAVVGSEFDRQYRRAMSQAEVVRFEAASTVQGGRWLEVRAFPLPDGIGVSFRDVTERRQRRDASRSYALLLESMSEGVSLAAEDGTIVYTNPAEDRMFGYAPGELVGRPVSIQNAYPEEENERRVAEVIEHLKAHGSWEGEWRNRRKDGSEFTSASRITAIEIGGAPHWICVQRDITATRNSEAALREETQALEILNRTGAAIAAELDLDRIVQVVTDAAVQLTGAQFGAFFYNVLNEQGGSYTLYTLSGVSRDAFSNYPMPRNTKVFEPTFVGAGILRSGDITKDPRYGHNAPYSGMPEGHLPVRSYLAAPVMSRAGEVLGGLFFGHEKPDVFGDRAERLVVGIAAQAAIAIDNARLFQGAQWEIRQRARAEKHQRLLINELNHRVKNTLATVQAIAAQTFRGTDLPGGLGEVFQARLMALSNVHDVLTRESWEGADLGGIVAGTIAPYEASGEARFHVEGPAVRLEPQAALKYGALSNATGRVLIEWRVADGDPPILHLVWQEEGGPPVSPPSRRGFGSRLIERSLSGDVKGEVRVDYAPTGVVCTVEAPLRGPRPALDDVGAPGGA
jgi:PAS domain S-box-containing protein